MQTVCDNEQFMKVSYNTVNQKGDMQRDVSVYDQNEC